MKAYQIVIGMIVHSRTGKKGVVIRIKKGSTVDAASNPNVVRIVVKWDGEDEESIHHPKEVLKLPPGTKRDYTRNLFK